MQARIHIRRIAKPGLSRLGRRPPNAVDNFRGAAGGAQHALGPFQGASCRRSVTVVAVREIAIAVIARIETTEPAVEAAPEAAVEATPEAAVKATPEAAAVKTTGLGSPSADRGGQRESNDRNRQQQLTG